MTITMNVFSNIKQGKPTHTESMSISELLDIFREGEHQALAAKEQAKAFSLTRFAAGKARQDRNAELVTGIVLDIDTPMTLEEVAALQEKLLGKAAVLYSTYSSEVDAYKLRVVLPLAEPVPAADYKASGLPIRAAKLLGAMIDPTCQSPSHVYFLPTCQPGEEDIHLLEVSDADEGWCIEDFPELEEDDRKRYLSQATGSAAGKPGSNADEILKIYQMIDKVIAEYLGHEPIYAESKFHRYANGYWQAVEYEELRKELITCHFKKKLGIAQVNAILDGMKALYIAKDFPVAVGPSYVACCQNATFDLLTGQAVANLPNYYLRSCFPVAFAVTATSPRWLRFLDDCFAGDADKAEKIALLQEYFGYLLVSSTEYQAMLWLVGAGSNGKSVINEIVTELLGEQNVSAVPLSDLSRRFQSAELAGKLANICDEAGAEGLLADDMIKQVVAGNRIQGERKNKDPFYFRATARILVAMNDLPRTKDTSHGYFRRILILKFNNIVAPEQADRNLVQVLKAELPGIFAWAVEGFQRLKANDGFTIPASSTLALSEYREDANPVISFFNELCVQASPPAVGSDPKKRVEHRTLVQDVYQVYREYCTHKGLMPKGAPMFGKEFLRLLGISQPQKSSGKRYYPVTIRDPKTVGYRHMAGVYEEYGAARTLDRVLEKMGA